MSIYASYVREDSGRLWEVEVTTSSTTNEVVVLLTEYYRSGSNWAKSSSVTLPMEVAKVLQGLDLDSAVADLEAQAASSSTDPVV